MPFDPSHEKSRLNQVIDTAFFVRSHHSSMAQVVDMVAYLFRLHLELEAYGVKESYPGEKEKIADWIRVVTPKCVPFDFAYPKNRSHSQFIEFLSAVKAKGVS